jgi:hypothetical protein
MRDEYAKCLVDRCEKQTGHGSGRCPEHRRIKCKKCGKELVLKFGTMGTQHCTACRKYPSRAPKNDRDMELGGAA